jgi:putative ABC transport system substrate-binding protein
MKVEPFPLHCEGGPRKIPGAFAAMSKQRVDALVVGEDPLDQHHNAAIAATGRLAPAYLLPDFPPTCRRPAASIGYGANRPLLYARAANFADRIFKGAKAGDLPIEARDQI